MCHGNLDHKHLRRDLDARLGHLARETPRKVSGAALIPKVRGLILAWIARLRLATQPR